MTEKLTPSPPSLEDLLKEHVDAHVEIIESKPGTFVEVYVSRNAQGRITWLAPGWIRIVSPPTGG